MCAPAVRSFVGVVIHMDLELADKCFIVTGAASGIGAATTETLLREQARVVAVDLSTPGYANSHGADRLLCLHADVSDETQVEAMVRDAGIFGGRIDGLANVAGLGVRASISATSSHDWMRTFEVNTAGTFLTCKHAIAAMLADGIGGAIVNVSSAAAISAVGERAAYVASKAAVSGLTRSITVDYAARGIRANEVAPGTVASPWIDRILDGVADPAATREAMAQRQAVERLGTPHEIANFIAFLLSERASFMHGSQVIVDGGFCAR